MDPYIGEIRMFGGIYAPLDWLMCDGNSVAIADYPALFNLIGTIYGGDGINAFNLPDLRSRALLHRGGSFPLGTAAGQESVSLTSPQLAAHTHGLGATTTATSASPANAVLSGPTSGTLSGLGTFAASPVTTSLTPSIGAVGGSGAHANVQPYLGLTFIIATVGTYPSQS